MTDILKIIFVDNIRDLGRALEIRDQVFVKGQGVDSVLENDGLDSIQDIHNGNAVVILALLDQQPIGTARMIISRSEKIIGKVGRISILEQFRKNGIKSMQTPVAGATWYENKSSGDFTATMGWDQCGSINEPYASMNRMNHRYMRPLGDSKHGRNNFVRWDTENAKKFSKIV